MSNPFASVVAALSAVVLSAALAAPARGESVSFSTTTLTPGQPFTVTVNLNGYGGTPLAYLGVDLTFDPTAVSIAGPSSVHAGAIVPSGSAADGFAASVGVAGGVGHLSVSYFGTDVVGGSDYLAGDGSFFTFDGVAGPGAKAGAIDFAGTGALDGNNLEPVALTSGGPVAVSLAAATPLPPVAAGAAGLLGLTAAGRRLRRWRAGGGRARPAA